jgi:hypothetical protein
MMINPFFTGEFYWIFSLFVRYSTLLHLPPLIFYCVGGCRDRTQDSCDYGIGFLFQTLPKLDSLFTKAVKNSSRVRASLNLAWHLFQKLPGIKFLFQKLSGHGAEVARLPGLALVSEAV